MLGVALSVTCAWADIRDPKGVAVVVGNRNYRNERVPEVSYAHRDASAFQHYVVEVLGYDPDNVIYLEDADQAKLESVFGNERSHEGLLWRYLDPEGGSDVVVFYSGHG
ncbi:MAG: caspase family protein, partial [Deltaproteobacteria bacterium]|nr:caspase family protein [Deltaproteobacteria bacterium]